MNRKCRQNVATENRRTFTDKDNMHRIQTLGNDKKMPCWTAKVAFIRVGIMSSYVTSILITKLTFAMFLLKLSTLSAIFLFVSVLSLLCGRSTGVFHYFFFLSIRYQTFDIRH